MLITMSSKNLKEKEAETEKKIKIYNKMKIKKTISQIKVIDSAVIKICFLIDVNILLNFYLNFFFFISFIILS